MSIMIDLTNVQSFELDWIRPYQQNNIQCNLSAVVVTLEFDLGHQNWNESVQLNGGIYIYHHANLKDLTQIVFEKGSKLTILQSGTCRLSPLLYQL